MKYLAIDTSGTYLTAAVNIDGKIYGGFHPDCGLQHSVTMMPEIDKALKESGYTIADLDFIAVTVGPGSFTGIRIGVSAVKAFAYAYNKKVLPLTSFDTIAYNKEGGKVLAIVDARHDNFYACGYIDKKISIKPCFIDGQKLDELSKEYAVLSFAPIEGHDCEVVDVFNGFLKAIEENADLITEDRESIVPLYVKKSQAEEGL